MSLTSVHFPICSSGLILQPQWVSGNKKCDHETKASGTLFGGQLEVNRWWLLHYLKHLANTSFVLFILKGLDKTE